MLAKFHGHKPKYTEPDQKYCKTFGGGVTFLSHTVCVALNHSQPHVDISVLLLFSYYYIK